MLPRTLEPEVMDTAEEARDYDAMDHGEVNRAFVDDFLAAAGSNLDRTSAPILDVGTGTALIPIELCRRTSDISLLGIDLAEEMLNLGRRNVERAGLASRITLHKIDAKAMPWPDGAFPAAMSNSIVHHIPDPALVFTEMIRLVAPGGLLFVRDLMRPATSEEVERIVQAYAGEETPHQQQLFRQSLHAALTVDEVRTILARHGLPARSAAATSDRHWTVTWHRPAC